jgi:hypothetical protein
MSTLTSSIALDNGSRIQANDVQAKDRPTRVVSVAIDGDLTIFLPGWRGDQAVVDALDNLIEPLAKLRQAAFDRLQDAAFPQPERITAAALATYRDRHDL